MTSSRVVGPALAGLLVATVGFGWCFLSDAISYVAVLVALYKMRPSELRRPPVTPKAKRQIREGLRYARGVRELWVPLVMMAVVGTLSYNFQTVFPIFTSHDLHGDGTTFTILFSVVSVGALVGALRTARRTTSNVRSVAMAALGYGVGDGGHGDRPEPVARATPWASASASRASRSWCRPPRSSSSRPHPRCGAACSRSRRCSSWVPRPSAGPIVGWVSDQFGARYAIALGAVAALGAGAWGLAKSRANAPAVEEVLDVESVKTLNAELAR